MGKYPKYLPKRDQHLTKNLLKDCRDEFLWLFEKSISSKLINLLVSMKKNPRDGNEKKKNNNEYINRTDKYC